VNSIAVSQRKRAIEDMICRAINNFEQEHCVTVDGIKIGRLDIVDGLSTCTHVNIALQKEWIQ